MIKQEAIAYYAFDAVEQLHTTTNDPRANTYHGHTDNYEFEDEIDAIIKFYCPATKNYYKEFALDRKVVAFLIYKSRFFPKTIQLLGTDGMMFKYVKSRGLFTSVAMETREQTGTVCWNKRVPIALQDEIGAPKIRISIGPEIWKTFIDAKYDKTSICHVARDAEGNFIPGVKARMLNLEINSLFTAYGEQPTEDESLDQQFKDHETMEEVAARIEQSMEEK